MSSWSSFIFDFIRQYTYIVNIVVYRIGINWYARLQSRVSELEHQLEDVRAHNKVLIKKLNNYGQSTTKKETAEYPQDSLPMQRKFAEILVFNEGHKFAYECAQEAGYEGDNATLT